MSNKAAGDTSWIASRNTAWSRERSVVLDAAKTGEKRKRGAHPQEDSGIAEDQRTFSRYSSNISLILNA
jgi:hypothetical protein